MFGSLLKIIPLLDKIISVVKNIYDRYVRRKIVQEGKDEANADAQAKIFTDQLERSKIAAKVARETEDEINTGLVDPRS
jgi:hypothetical protein